MGLSTLTKLSVGLSVLCLVGCADEAYAGIKPTYNNPYINKVVDSIYKAEGGSKTRHPYGILSIKVKSSDEARKRCYEVVNWRYQMWLSSSRKESFIKYLSKSYCPPGALNDPLGLNHNWVRNVNHFMEVIR
jgi:hypothetical protein